MCKISSTCNFFDFKKLQYPILCVIEVVLVRDAFFFLCYLGTESWVDTFFKPKVIIQKST
jgi:hypothetical protein